LIPGRVDLKGNPNLIIQNNSPSLDSSLSSIKSQGLGESWLKGPRDMVVTDFGAVEICHYDFYYQPIQKRYPR
jgi:hypothetical protein